MTIQQASPTARLVVALTALLWMGAAHAARYEIDPLQTRTTYETRYLGFIPVRGVFERMTGVLSYEPGKPIGEREAVIHVIIDTTTLKPSNFDSESKRRMLRGPEFFDVDRFPIIEFKSSRFRYEAGKLIAIDGDITLLGVSRPVILKVSKSGCEVANPARAARCTASAELTLKRFDFGMKSWFGTVSDDVTIAVELVAVEVDAVPGAARASEAKLRSEGALTEKSGKAK